MLFLMSGCCLPKVLSTQGRGVLEEALAGHGARLRGSQQRHFPAARPGFLFALPPASGTAL